MVFVTKGECWDIEGGIYVLISTYLHFALSDVYWIILQYKYKQMYKLGVLLQENVHWLLLAIIVTTLVITSHY